MPSDSHLLARAVARLNRRLRQERRSELTASQLSALGAIHQLGLPTPSQVAVYERVQPPSMTRTLNGLADLGFIERSPHPDDGRQSIVTISPKGAAALAAERERRDAWLHEQLAHLTAEERKILRDAAVLLQRLAEAE